MNCNDYRKKCYDQIQKIAITRYGRNLANIKYGKREKSSATYNFLNCEHFERWIDEGSLKLLKQITDRKLLDAGEGLEITFSFLYSLYVNDLFEQETWAV